MGDLKSLSDAASRGPWQYRPDEYDDWGMIRGGVITGTLIGDIKPPVAKSIGLWNDRDYDAHRAAGTYPMEPNGRFIVELVNAYREGRLVEKENNSENGPESK